MKALKAIHPSIVCHIDFENGHSFTINSGSNQGYYVIESDADMQWLIEESNRRWIEQFEDEEIHVTNYRCSRWEQEFEQQLNFMPIW